MRRYEAHQAHTVFCSLAEKQVTLRNRWGLSMYLDHEKQTEFCDE
jgi:hypothetical protein